MEAIGQLAGGIAHDFNNLLMLIQAHNSRLRERISSDFEAQQDAQQIEQAVIRAAALTRQLLAFSRKQVLQPAVINLNTIVTDSAKLLERLIEKGVEMEIRLDPALNRVKADPVQMEQIIFNLAVNARDAMPKGGKLILATRNTEVSTSRDRRGMPPGDYVVLTVTDTGIGMDASTQAHIFEPFFTTKDPGKGTGLGLATVYGVVQQTGGWIWVSSELGLGTTFEIFFPRADEVPEPKPVKTSTGIKTSINGTETILLVEDQDGIRDMAAEFLRRSGYQILNAEDGTRAMEIAKQHNGDIHLLITDMSMPNMGGRELAAQLRQARPQTKVLFMSGHPDHTSPTNNASTDAPVLQKPFALDELGQKIRALLDAEPR
jgi:CheY-like chemotaxis protein